MSDSSKNKGILELIIEALGDKKKPVQKTFIEFDASKHEVVCTLPSNLQRLQALHVKLCEDGAFLEDSLTTLALDAKIPREIEAKMYLVRRQIDTVETLMMCSAIEMFPALNNFSQVVFLKDWKIAGVIDRKQIPITRRDVVSKSLH